MRSAEAVAGMPCPVCKTPLAMAERHGIEIDYCPTCRGVWLDRGELDKIIERSAAEQAPAAPQPSYAPPPQPSYQQPQGNPWSGSGGYRNDDRYHGKKRKKSFLEELLG
ncbi:zf-TFIIB domain-containing protein [Sphingomonas sp. S1-29]|uniref:TFIIB-type zinc ribbon-containing protein n=1 Tax=Sphingomonas sp. S1-29 TaxID=2991074 RepID=UPI0022403281|nr:zf-TFIIB domain-containing protein [Sphingomonas sp. S1-29]UZK70928.1 zf-TFIIB domain-containing protein [Sphingomonas sp. S1-29]